MDKKRDLVDWLQAGASVYTAYKLHEITNPPVDWDKVCDRVAAAENAQTAEDIDFDSRKVAKEIEKLPDNVYGYMTLAARYHLMRNDNRSHYRSGMRPWIDLCEARMRWMLKQFSPIVARRIQKAFEAALALKLLENFLLRKLQGEWTRKCKIKNIYRFLAVYAPLTLAMAVIYMASPGHLALIFGLFALAFVMLAVFDGNPQKPQRLKELETKTLAPFYDIPHVTEQFKTLVDAGAITQSEADRKTVDNVDAALGIFDSYAAQFADLSAQLGKEEVEYQKAVSLRYKTERENKRWGEKLAAEEAMRLQYSPIRTI